MILPEVGRVKLAQELQSGKKGEVEVIVAAELGSLADPVGQVAAEAVC
jgi:hypothetical protein